MRAFGVLLLLLLGLAVLVDRGAVLVAEAQVGRQVAVQGGLPSAPDVDIGGFPFLTQAIGGRYDEVRVTLTSDDLGRPDGTRADVVFRGVRLPLAAVLAGDVQEVPVERIEGTATLSYELLAAELGEDTTLEREGNRLRITRTVEVLGSSVPLTALGTAELDDDELVIEVDEAGGAGVDLPNSLVGRASDLVDLRYPVELPFGLELTGVSPAEDGVDVLVEADDSVLSSE